MKFRTNTQKKRIDVWLIYRCESCSETWNLPIFERMAVGDIAPDQFQAIARNDRALANSYAFDRARLDHHSDRVEESVDAAVEWRLESRQPIHLSDLEISIRLVLPWRARLDRFVAPQLDISRSRFHELHAMGLLAIMPWTRNGLRGPVTDGQRIAVKLAQDAISSDLIAAIRGRATS